MRNLLLLFVSVTFFCLKTESCLSQSKFDVSATYGLNAVKPKVDFDSGGVIGVQTIKKSIINLGVNYHWNDLLQVSLDLGFGDYYIGFCDTPNTFDVEGNVINITVCSRTDYKSFARIGTGLGVKLNLLKQIQIIPSLGLNYSFYEKERNRQEGYGTRQTPEGITTYAEKNNVSETLNNIIHLHFGVNLRFRLHKYVNAILKTNYNLGLSTIATHDISYAQNTEAIEDITREELEMSEQLEALTENANVSHNFSGWQVSVGFEIPLIRTKSK